MKRATLLALAATLVVGALPAVASARTIRLGDNFFRPGKLTVDKGTSITWKWVGRGLHNVTVTSGPRKFHSRDKTSGTFTRTLSRRGTYKYVCTIHGFAAKITAR